MDFWSYGPPWKYLDASSLKHQNKLCECIESLCSLSIEVLQLAVQPEVRRKVALKKTEETSMERLLRSASGAFNTCIHVALCLRVSLKEDKGGDLLLSGNFKVGHVVGVSYVQEAWVWSNYSTWDKGRSMWIAIGRNLEAWM